PEDIRLVCYENDPITQFSEPSLTTIEYPFEALSYTACERLMAQFNGEDIPITTELTTRVFYRDSCGCTVNNVRPMQHRPDHAGAAAGPMPPSADIARRLPHVPEIALADTERLAAAFQRSLSSGEA